MLLNNYILFLACSSIVVLSSTVPELQLASPGSIKVNQTCKRDNECIVHAYCKDQKTCFCDLYYAPSSDMATCRITAGASCNDQKGCSTMTNAECSENVCTCRDNFIINPTNSSDCIMCAKNPSPTQLAGSTTQDPIQLAGPRAQYPTQLAGPRTQYPTQLTGSRTQDPIQLAGPRTQYSTQLTGSRTQDPTQLTAPRTKDRICDTDHHFVNETGTCIKMRDMNESCKQNYECFLNKNGSNALECKNGKCADDKANPSKKNGCPVHQPTLMVLATLIIGTTLRQFV